MKIQSLRFLLVYLLLLTFTTQTSMAQEKVSSPQEPTAEIEGLRKKVQEQGTQINQMQQSLQHQSSLIEQQQKLLESLVEKLTLVNQPKLAHAAIEKPASIIEPQIAVSNTTAASVANPPRKETEGSTGLPKPPQNIETGYGKIKFNGLLQGWFAGGNANFSDTFRVRRAELKFTGEISPRARWTVMVDPTKSLSINNNFTTIDDTRVINDSTINQAGRILQDAFITIDASKNFKINVGQFKVPLGLEGGQSSAALETVERALFASDRSRGGNYGDVRDIGVMAYGPLGGQVNYQIGVFNGSGENQNDLDKNDQKAVVGRLVFRPSFIKGLQVGGSGAWGNGAQENRPRRDRIGTELLFVSHNFMVKSELVSGKDAELHRLGYYTHFGYKIRPKLETVFRFDVWDPDRRFETNLSNILERDFITGLNYYITENNVKLQVNYLRKTYAAHLLPSRNLFLVNLQTSW
jgi:phosphate-selective porin